MGVRVAQAFLVGVGGREKGGPEGADRLQLTVATSHKANNNPTTLRWGSEQTLLRTGHFGSTFGDILEAKDKSPSSHFIIGVPMSLCSVSDTHSCHLRITQVYQVNPVSDIVS